MSAYSVLFLILLAYFVNYSAGQQCDATGLKRFDAVFARLITLGGSGRSFPENKQEGLKKFCDQSAEYINEIDKYRGKCTKQLTKQVTGVVVYSFKQVLTRYCKRPSKRLDELMLGFTCANRAKPQFDKCYTHLIDSFLGAIHAQEKNRIPHTCCEYYKLFDCLKEKVVKSKGCKESEVEAASSFIRELFGNLIEMLCADYVEGSDKCDNLGSPPKKKKSQRRSKSFIIPYIDLLNSLPEQPKQA